jgi:glycosyltransferase involved in cell wall biosynthesis
MNVKTGIKKTISVISGCYNEEKNLSELYDRLVAVFQRLPQYDYEIIMADNCSTDGSREVLRAIAARDKNFKVILNSNNFGHIRSPYNAFLQASGDAVVGMCSDLQDPPEMILDFIREWERGAKIVCAIKAQSKENFMIFAMRRFYYWLLAKLSETQQVRNFTGFGLYDRKVVDAIKRYRDPYPYMRGLIGEIGFKRVEIPYVQDRRKHGQTKNNFFTLYDVAMLGFTNHSKLPLRLTTFFGFCLACLSFLVAAAYFIYKLLFWNTFNLGLAPMVIGMFFFFAVQMIFIGVIGEYVGAILTHVKDHPLVIEDERINFD